MANLGVNFDATQVEQSIDQLPVGWYLAHIAHSERRQNKHTQGENLSLEFHILEGQFTNWKIWEQLNLWNPSEKASQIAQGQLSTIAHAVGVLQFHDSYALHGFPLMIRVAHNAEGKAEIKGYKAVEQQGHQPSPGRAYAENNPMGQQTAQPPQQPPQQPHNSNINPNINPNTGQPYAPHEMQQQNQQR